jgi:putative membrane protein
LFVSASTSDRSAFRRIAAPKIFVAPTHARLGQRQDIAPDDLEQPPDQPRVALAPSAHANHDPVSLMVCHCIVACSHTRPRGASAMRWFHLSVIALLAAAIILFAVQNLHIVTMSFLGFSATVPMALLAVVFYLLGMATGGSLLALLRWLVEGAKPRPTASS